MQPAEQFTSIRQEFLEAGCTITFNALTGVVTAVYANITQEYNLPPLLQANAGAVPGWFLAGIWDDMGLPARPLSPPAIQQYFSAWGFHNRYNLRVWIKNLGDKVLLYHNYTFFIAPNTESVWTATYFPESADEVSLIPTKSIYHVIKLFEEHNWFRLNKDERPMPSQNIDAYRR